MVPNDPYVFIGDELVLSCNLTKPLDEDSRSMYFTRNRNERIPSRFVTIVNSRSIKLRMPILSPEDSGNYVCKINKTNGAVGLIGMQEVTVECKFERFILDQLLTIRKLEHLITVAFYEKYWNEMEENTF